MDDEEPVFELDGHHLEGHSVRIESEEQDEVVIPWLRRIERKRTCLNNMQCSRSTDPVPRRRSMELNGHIITSILSDTSHLSMRPEPTGLAWSLPADYPLVCSIDVKKEEWPEEWHGKSQPPSRQASLGG